MAKQVQRKQTTNHSERRTPTIVQWGIKDGQVTGTRARWLNPDVANAILDTAEKRSHVVLQFAPQDSLQSVRLTLGAFARRKGYKAHSVVEGNTLRISLEKLEED